MQIADSEFNLSESAIIFICYIPPGRTNEKPPNQHGSAAGESLFIQFTGETNTGLQTVDEANSLVMEANHMDKIHNLINVFGCDAMECISEILLE